MIEVLKKYGFKYVGSCNCNGIYTQKYKRGDYMIRWRSKRYKFVVQYLGKMTGGWQPVTELENKLKEINELLESNKEPV